MVMALLRAIRARLLWTDGERGLSTNCWLMVTPPADKEAGTSVAGMVPAVNERKRASIFALLPALAVDGEDQLEQRVATTATTMMPAIATPVIKALLPACRFGLFFMASLLLFSIILGAWKC